MIDLSKVNERLTKSYETLILEALRFKYSESDNEKLKELFLFEFKPYEIKDFIAEYDDYLSVDHYMDFCNTRAALSFIKDRIGKDFLVFEGLEDYLFCIHSIDDYLTDFKKTQRKEKNHKSTNNKI